MRLPVTIPLQPSRRLLAAQGGAHAVAAGAVVVLVLPWPVRALLLAVIAASLLLFLQRRQLPAIALHLGAHGALEVEQKVGVREMARLLPATTVFPGLILLVLQCEERRMALPLPPDATGPEGHRQLRLWLKWRAVGE